MRINLTVFDNKEAEVICDIIYEKLCDLGLNPEGFTWLIDVNFALQHLQDGIVYLHLLLGNLFFILIIHRLEIY